MGTVLDSSSARLFTSDVIFKIYRFHILESSNHNQTVVRQPGTHSCNLAES